jgi:aerobic C4-dicarboxylate transport protein
LRKLFTNLTFWVLLAIIAGVLIGHFLPGLAMHPVLKEPIKTRILGQDIKIDTTVSEVLSGFFISIVKLFINPIIFLTITLGIISMGDLKKVGRVGAKSLVYFEIVTTIALIIGIVVAIIIKPGAGIDVHSAEADISKYRNSRIEWANILKNNSTLQVLIGALIIGIILNFNKHRQKIAGLFQWIANYIFKALHGVMLLAPLGALGGMAFTIAKYGLHSLLPLAKLMASVYATMIIFILGGLWLVLRMYRVNLIKFLKYIREELLVVLGTSSSEAALPSLMEKLEKVGCSRSVVGLVVPAGYSFNLDGTTIYLSMSIIFLTQVFNVHLHFSEVVAIIGILMVTSKGAAGVAGSGLTVLAATLASIKIIPMEGIAFLVGVDRFMSEARAITNFIGNGVATIWIANNEKAFDRKKMEGAFNTDKT